MRHNTVFTSSAVGHHPAALVHQGMFDDEDDDDDPEDLYEPLPEENGDDSHNYECVMGGFVVEGVVVRGRRCGGCVVWWEVKRI